MTRRRILALALVLALAGAFFALDLGRYLGLDVVKGAQGDSSPSRPEKF